jgi:hypothetical protein
LGGVREQAVQCFHDDGLCLGDVKPENFLVQLPGDPSAKLAVFTCDVEAVVRLPKVSWFLCVCVCVCVRRCVSMRGDGCVFEDWWLCFAVRKAMSCCQALPLLGGLMWCLRWGPCARTWWTAR